VLVASLEEGNGINIGKVMLFLFATLSYFITSLQISCHHHEFGTLIATSDVYMASPFSLLSVPQFSLLMRSRPSCVSSSALPDLLVLIVELSLPVGTVHFCLGITGIAFCLPTPSVNV
jgi:hypothetical protein